MHLTSAFFAKAGTGELLAPVSARFATAGCVAGRSTRVEEKRTCMRYGAEGNHSKDWAGPKQIQKFEFSLNFQNSNCLMFFESLKS